MTAGRRARAARPARLAQRAALAIAGGAATARCLACRISASRQAAPQAARVQVLRGRPVRRPVAQGRQEVAKEAPPGPARAARPRAPGTRSGRGRGAPMRSPARRRPLPAAVPSASTSRRTCRTAAPAAYSAPVPAPPAPAVRGRRRPVRSGPSGGYARRSGPSGRSDPNTGPRSGRTGPAWRRPYRSRGRSRFRSRSG